MLYTNHFAQLPISLLVKIVSNLNLKDSKSLRNVNTDLLKKFNTMNFWKMYYFVLFGKSFDRDITWKDIDMMDYLIHDIEPNMLNYTKYQQKLHHEKIISRIEDIHKSDPGLIKIYLKLVGIDIMPLAGSSLNPPQGNSKMNPFNLNLSYLKTSFKLNYFEKEATERGQMFLNSMVSIILDTSSLNFFERIVNILHSPMVYANKNYWVRNKYYGNEYFIKGLLCRIFNEMLFVRANKDSPISITDMLKIWLNRMSNMGIDTFIVKHVNYEKAIHFFRNYKISEYCRTVILADFLQGIFKC